MNDMNRREQDAFLMGTVVTELKALNAKVDARCDAQDKVLAAIQTTLEKQNSRISTLEKWRSGLVAVWTAGMAWFGLAHK